VYYYIVDPQKINQRSFERIQNQLYSSLSEYRVSGEVVRVTGLRTINQLVESAIAHGAGTVVAVGNDETFQDVMNAVKDREVVVGYIPITETELSKILGIKNIEQACKTIGLRRIAHLDVGVVNNVRFLTKLNFGLSPSGDSGGWLNFFRFGIVKKLFSLPVFEVKLSADESFSASLSAIGGMIINSREVAQGEAKISDPTDRILDVLLLPKLSKGKIIKYRQQILSGNFEKIPDSSLLHVRKLEILSPEGLPLKSGGRVVAKTPATIEILPQALKIIVGRDRSF
jgi:diacylglycerol kinase family enzyme